MSTPSGSTAVEIGSHLGASACFLAAGLREVNGVLYCVDTWNNDAMGSEPTIDTYATFTDNIKDLVDIIRPVRMNSAHISREDLPKSLELVFIDGDHEYSAAAKDVEVTAWRVRPGGVMVFHDSVGTTGVGRAIGELLATGNWVLAGQVHLTTWLRRVPN
ncbi:class I SAM-dependent methyltransferase [Humisphaera borealis]|uniref:Class I SAM-dependent methyltransferase n=1 Tax=Humisphaera borealis TaxID=2807512 RepID=A0A7M2X1M3_9BACT|nr:class I SAM-dependent methyltransferase [Humisphaera borealis]